MSSKKTSGYDCGQTVKETSMKVGYCPYIGDLMRNGEDSS
jgi:hypothetical protein